MFLPMLGTTGLILMAEPALAMSSICLAATPRFSEKTWDSLTAPARTWPFWVWSLTIAKALFGALASSVVVVARAVAETPPSPTYWPMNPATSFTPAVESPLIARPRFFIDSPVRLTTASSLVKSARIAAAFLGPSAPLANWV